jgi:hypothetical protein
VRRHEDPLPSQRIVASVGMFGGVEFHEG